MNQLNMSELQFFGQRLRVKCSDTDPEMAAEVIDLVTARIEAAEGRIKGGSLPHQVVLLAMLDLAEEYLQAKRRTSQYQSEMETRCQELTELLK